MALSVLEDDSLHAEINVTPLVDVVLVLLVILMVVAPMLPSALPIELPEIARTDAEEAKGVPVLAIAADGALTLEGEPLPGDDLARRLASVFAERADKRLLLAADRHLAYATVVDVLDACHAAGVTRVGVATRRMTEGG